MSASSPAPRIPLTAADCFLRALDAEVRRYNGASHNSQLVLRLGPGFDVGAFEKWIREVVPRQPILTAPIRRRLLLGAPEYRTDAPANPALPQVIVHDAADAAAAQSAFDAAQNARLEIRRGELLRFDVVPRGGSRPGTDLAMTWVHMLFDGSGSENFLRWLDECARGERSPDALPSDEFGEDDPSAREPLELSFRERGDRARAFRAYMRSFAARPPHSLAGPLRRVRQDLTHRFQRFDPAESEAIVARAVEHAGFLTPMLFYLAATVRAHHAVFRARGMDPGSYVVPLPVNVRPRGAERAIFRTHVSLLWFQVSPEQADDLDGLIEVLKAQRRDAIRARVIENGRFAMDFVRMLPSRLYAHMTRRDLHGEMCSMFFAYTGEFLPGVDRIFGAEVESAYHVPPVPVSPGSCAAMSLQGGRFGVTHVHQRGLFSEEELHRFDEQLRRDLLGPA